MTSLNRKDVRPGVAHGAVLLCTLRMRLRTTAKRLSTRNCEKDSASKEKRKAYTTMPALAARSAAFCSERGQKTGGSITEILRMCCEFSIRKKRAAEVKPRDGLFREGAFCTSYVVSAASRMAAQVPSLPLLS